MQANKEKGSLSVYGMFLLLTLNGEHGVEHHIPYLAGHSEPELKVLIVVSEMIFLHCTHVRWQLRVVQSVMHAVIQDVKRERTRDNAICHSRREDGVRQLCEWSL